VATSSERKYLTPEERLRFYEHAQEISNLTHKILCMVLLYTGCRISEATHIRRGDIDPHFEILTIRTLKQRKVKRERKVRVPDFLVEMLQEQIATVKGTRLLSFSRWTGRRIVKRYMAEINIDGVKATPKGLRHAYAMGNLEELVPLPTIQKWLGHTNMNNTSHYLDFVGPEERALAERAWPHLKLAQAQPNTPSPAIMPPTPSMTEVELFDFEAPDQTCLDQMNNSIKTREAAGWSVSQIEHLMGNKQGAFPYTTGMMVVFRKPFTGIYPPQTGGHT